MLEGGKERGMEGGKERKLTALTIKNYDIAEI